MASRGNLWPGLQEAGPLAADGVFPGPLAAWDGDAERWARQEDLATLLHWSTAFDRWLAGLAPSTRRAYRRAWEDLCAFSEKGPEAILSADVQEWAEDLAGRALDPAVLRGLRRRGGGLVARRWGCRRRPSLSGCRRCRRSTGS